MPLRRATSRSTSRSEATGAERDPGPARADLGPRYPRAARQLDGAGLEGCSPAADLGLLPSPAPVGQNGARPKEVRACRRSFSQDRGRSYQGWGTPGATIPPGTSSRTPSEVAGRDVEHLLLEAGADELTETRNAQLATFVIGLVVLDAVERLGIEPTACAGHSLGEYTALVAAGAIGFEEAVRLVAERGEAMQEAAEDNPGVMLALAGIDDERARIACRRADGEVWLANSNTPRRVRDRR